jgi:hypothetical protein
MKNSKETFLSPKLPHLFLFYSSNHYPDFPGGDAIDSGEMPLVLIPAYIFNTLEGLAFR